MAALLAEKQWPKEIVFFQREMFLRLLQEAPVKTPACAMRRSALEDIGYFNDVWHSGSDWNFSCASPNITDSATSTSLRIQPDATLGLHAVTEKRNASGDAAGGIQKYQQP